ncbi:unnamed protein product [Didymodactylos carnosus]|uniref:NAD(P)(+)--arginine ADP-ribosyltransferase n=1 Tax=Didymodactylos carnosus TaxID=1234261 RepID=A0A814UMP4_9BILA|nr:unnamed protein product [Didymodactylos carnosus]CAF1176960.1 unnamed protein product [Didymodactylos carnosus]CAF3516535.1 unnamed protein product [Didymodactylos carnosus]CAF3940940.1 unnamed protein product [Didymodactylos carnosus]
MSEKHESDVQDTNSRLLIEDSKNSGNSKILGPIVGYAQEPLLPLADACAPLASIVHDISTYVSVALERTPDAPADGLTHDEAASIHLYTMEWGDGNRSLSSILNQTLKTDNREDLRPWFKYMKLFLTALIKIPCMPSQTAWRGERKYKSHEYSPGAQVTWWAFSSCATSIDALESGLGNTGERTLFSIELINARNIRAHSHFQQEDELLMLPGTYMEVHTVFNPAADLYIVHLRQMIPNEMLLEPPFEGAYLYPKPRSPWYKFDSSIAQIKSSVERIFRHKF